MQRVVISIAYVFGVLLTGTAWGSSDPCRLQEQALRTATRAVENQARKVARLQDRVSRTKQQRTDALLRNQDKGFRLLTDIYDAERYRAERLDAMDDCWWGYSCQGHHNLEASLDRRVRQTKIRYAEWIEQTVTLTARWDTKVKRMEADLALAITGLDAAQAAVIAAEEAYAACAATCHTCSTPV